MLRNIIRNFFVAPKIIGAMLKSLDYPSRFLFTGRGLNLLAFGFRCFGLDDTLASGLSRFDGYFCDWIYAACVGLVADPLPSEGDLRFMELNPRISLHLRDQ
jgi:hypothetical protein